MISKKAAVANPKENMVERAQTKRVIITKTKNKHSIK